MPETICPEHSGLTKAVEHLVKSTDAAWQKLDAYGVVLHDVREKVERISGYMNGRHETDHKVSDAYDRTLKVVRLVMYILVSLASVSLGLLPLIRR